MGLSGVEDVGRMPALVNTVAFEVKETSVFVEAGGAIPSSKVGVLGSAASSVGCFSCNEVNRFCADE